MIEIAYDLKDYQVTGGLPWMDDWFNIIAQAPGEKPLTYDAARPMLQTLLADRFQLKVHREVRDLPVYELTVGKRGSKMKHTPEESKRHPLVAFGLAPSGLSRFMVSNSSLFDFARGLIPVVGRPVFDKTGLEGNYDFTFEYYMEGSRYVDGNSAPGAVGPSIFTAIEEETGLKLQPTKAPVELLIVDSAAKPSEN
jgi:uncharacterized protein (TIGR03435 family)